MKLRDKLLLSTSIATLFAAAAPVAHAADKISLMVGGYEKIIYLPAKLAEGPATSRRKASFRTPWPSTFGRGPRSSTTARRCWSR
jgi:hypothetical protein